MNTVRTAALAILVAVLTMDAGAARAQYYAPQQPYYGGAPAWDAVPPEFAAVQQRGYRDGIEGAKKDFKNHRPPNVYNRDEFRNPHFIPPADRRDYKIGFQRGYDVAARHIWGPNPYPYGYRPY